MKKIIKHFNELNTKELYGILKLRNDIFIVEQECPYEDIDTYDLDAYHVFYKQEDTIIAYARVFKKEEDIILGRVISTRKRQGIATELLKDCIQLANEKYKANKIKIEAQVYAKSLYEKVGFKQTSKEFLEDGIPHIQMIYEKSHN